jgi:hypothetical protein
MGQTRRQGMARPGKSPCRSPGWPWRDENNEGEDKPPRIVRHLCQVATSTSKSSGIVSNHYLSISLRYCILRRCPLRRWRAGAHNAQPQWEGA